jgi:hypothetical protein
MAKVGISIEDWKSLLDPKPLPRYNRLTESRKRPSTPEFNPLDSLKRDALEMLLYPHFKERLIRQRRARDHTERINTLSRPRPRPNLPSQKLKWSWAYPTDDEVGPGTYDIQLPLGTKNPLSTSTTSPIAYFPKSARLQSKKEDDNPAPGRYDPNSKAVSQRSRITFFARSPKCRTFSPIADQQSSPGLASLSPAPSVKHYTFPKAKRCIDIRAWRDRGFIVRT